METTALSPRDRLIRSILRGFDLTEDVAGQLADDMSRGGSMAQALHWEFFVEHVRLVSEYATLADQLAASLVRQQAPSRWAELLPQVLKREVKYLYYVLRDGEEYGSWHVSYEQAI